MVKWRIGRGDGWAGSIGILGALLAVAAENSGCLPGNRCVELSSIVQLSDSMLACTAFTIAQFLRVSRRVFYGEISSFIEIKSVILAR